METRIGAASPVARDGGRARRGRPDDVISHAHGRHRVRSTRLARPVVFMCCPTSPDSSRVPDGAQALRAARTSIARGPREFVACERLGRGNMSTAAARALAAAVDAERAGA